MQHDAQGIFSIRGTSEEPEKEIVLRQECRGCKTRLSEEEKKERRRASLRKYDNKPEVREKRKAYLASPEKRAKDKAYYSRPEIKERARARAKAYRDKHRSPEWLSKRRAYSYTEHARERYRQYCKRNPIKPSAASLEKRKSKESRERINSRKRDRLRSDPQYQIRTRIRSRLSQFLRRKEARKSARTIEMLGCSWEQARRHIEAQFKPGMEWGNRGTAWHVDHIIPLSSVDVTNMAELMRVTHFTNLQPLWALENRRKGAKIMNEHQPALSQFST